MKDQFIRLASLFDIEIIDSLMIVENENKLIVTSYHQDVFERVMMFIYEIMKNDSYVEPFWSEVKISSKGNKFVFYA